MKTTSVACYINLHARACSLDPHDFINTIILKSNGTLLIYFIRSELNTRSVLCFSFFLSLLFIFLVLCLSHQQTYKPFAEIGGSYGNRLYGFVCMSEKEFVNLYYEMFNVNVTPKMLFRFSCLTTDMILFCGIIFLLKKG